MGATLKKFMKQRHSKEIMNWGPEYLLKHILILKVPCENIHREWWMFFYVQLNFSHLQHRSFNVTFATLGRQTCLIQVSL